MSEKCWSVYIIETECGKLYTGIAKDIFKRFEEHQNSKKGAKFFRAARPKKIVFSIGDLNRSEALKKEIQIYEKDLEQHNKQKYGENNENNKTKINELNETIQSITEDINTYYSLVEEQREKLLNVNNNGDNKNELLRQKSFADQS
jgi:putative endonuclease